MELGPPRFAAVGESVDLAPRDPDPDAEYRWRLLETPDDSTAAVAPDAPGEYVLECAGPEGRSRQTVRVFPGDAAVDPRGRRSGLHSGGRSGSGGNDREWSGSGSASGALGVGGDPNRPRVRLDGRLEDETVVLRAEARSRVGDDRPDPTLDVEFYVHDADEATLTASGRTAKLPVPGDPVRVYAVAVGDTGSVPDAVRVDPDGRVHSLTRPPDWSTRTTLYEVYVRGFTDAEDGQAFDELIGRLDDLADLGVDALWLTPVLEHDGADHGYNITDFFAIAEDLGEREDYERFLEAAHDRDMKVLFDLVCNHSARDHPHFQSAVQDPDSPSREWYEWEDENAPGTYFDWEHIANFDYSSLAVRRHVLDVVDEWADLVDGFRCDMAWAVPESFWLELRDCVKARDREFLLLDETIPYVADFHGLFDVHFDTTTYFALRQIGRGEEPAGHLLDALDQRQRVGFPDHAGFALYLENHDEQRYLEECSRAATEAAAAAQFTLPGVPLLYGGQEIGETWRRGRVHWDDVDEDLRSHYRRLIETRSAIPALGYRGDLEAVEFRSDASGVVAYAREADRRYVVVLNFGPGTATVDLPGEALEGTDVVTGRTVLEDGTVAVDSAVILAARE